MLIANSQALFIELVDHLWARRQVDRVTVFEADFTVGTHGNGIRQAGIVDMKKCIRTEMLGHADRALPCATAFDHIDMFGADADGGGVVLGGFLARDEVHSGRADETGHKRVHRPIVNRPRRVTLNQTAVVSGSAG